MKLRASSWAVMVLLSGIAASAAAQETRRAYIVQLQDQPVASYIGGIASMAATQPSAGSRLDYQVPAVQDYVRYLGNQQNLVLSTISGARVFARYDTVLNGFAALLTDAEVVSLQRNAAVRSVQPDEARHLLTISTPEFLGLNKADGLWTKLGGDIKGSLAGEGMVVGIVDSGVWPESPAFADRVDADGVPTFDPNATLVYGAPPATFTGGCDTGPGFVPALHCNNKLVGARFYSAGFKEFLGATRSAHWSEFVDSPRDSADGTDPILGTTGHGGHGTHTASTAAGNHGATAIISGAPLGLASGMAPRARVSTYKVCWTYTNPAATDGTGASNSCFGSDIVSAIDQAVKDGVNVINFSISGGTSVNDDAEQAFLRAANAGVFVAASAGNSGPANQVAHISPWLTTVAASTHDRGARASVKLGNGSSYLGASSSAVDLASNLLVRAEDVGMGGGNASLCFSSETPDGQVLLDPAKVNGKIVVCTRGGNARVDKSLAVKGAGGVGMVLADDGNGLVADVHSVPSVHVSKDDGTAIKAYVVSQGNAASASLSKTALVKIPAPIMAGFSSRGPNRFDANQLKPDLTAPGVDVIASVTESLTEATKNLIATGAAAGAPTWASYQGTSMSSPHVAGLAALLKQLHPTWSPAAIKSALMTTAYSTLNDGLAGMQNGMLPWAQGAGHVNPNGAANPGLVYDLGANDYVQYQCKVNKPAVSPATLCNGNTLGETYNLNLPSLTVGSLSGVTTLTRTVTNVGTSEATYTSSTSLPGFNVLVTPASFVIAPGAKQTFTVRLTPTSAVINNWAYGHLTWNDGAGHVVRSPLNAMLGRPITAPAELTSDRPTGSKIFAVKTGFSGRMTAIKGGLKEVTVSDWVTKQPNPDLTEAQIKALCLAGVGSDAVHVHKFDVPVGAVAARFALRNADTSAPGKSDFDLYVIKSDGSGGTYKGVAESVEFVQLGSPSAGTYHVCPVAYATNVEATDMSYRLSSWVVTPADMGGKFNVALPGNVVANGNPTLGVSWSGLTAGKRYLGAVQLLDAAPSVQATTVIRIDPSLAAPQPTEEAVRAVSMKH